MTNEEINRKIAEDVMGECWHEFPPKKDGVCYIRSFHECIHCGRKFPWPESGHKNYPTDIADAWKVVEFLHKKGWEICFDSYHLIKDAKFQCAFLNEAKDITISGKAESAPMAICLAALKTVEVK